MVVVAVLSFGTLSTREMDAKEALFLSLAASTVGSGIASVRLQDTSIRSWFSPQGVRSISNVPSVPNIVFLGPFPMVLLWIDEVLLFPCGAR